MSNIPKNKFLPVIILLIILVCIILMRREKRPIQDPSHITKLPKFESEDIKGNKIRSSVFKGKNLYVQFINSNFQPDIRLFELVYTKWINEDLNFLGIINNSTTLDLKDRYNSKNITFIENDYFNLCSVFKLDDYNGFYFLINKKGVVVNSGKNDLGYNKGPKIFLQELIKGDYFSISEFISENNYVNDFKWFSQVNELIENNDDKEYFIISLYTKICDSCSGGNVTRVLNDLYSRDKNELIYILSILNRNFGNADIINLKEHLKISYPVIRADNELNSKWDLLIEQYQEDLLTDIIFIVEKSGNILKIAYKTCDCYPTFFDYAYNLISKAE